MKKANNVKAVPTMVIDTKTANKQEMITALTNLPVDSVEKNLLERIQYALGMAKKNLTKVTKADLISLCNEVMSSFTPAPVPVENSVKPATKTKETTPKVQKAEKVAPEEKKPVEDAVKPVKKLGAKKPDSKKESTEKAPVKKPAPKTKAMEDYFPESLEHETLGTLTSLKGQLTTFDELKKAVEEDGRNIIFAAKWTKSDAKRNMYAPGQVTKNPASFPNDLDILQAVIVCQTLPRVWAMSAYTEAMFWFDESNLKYDDDHGYRVSEGMEFELYEAESEDTEE